MGSACGCDFDAVVSRTTHPTARKEHACMECGHVIRPGETYRRQDTIWSDEPGAWATYKACERCADLMDSFTERGFCWCWEIFFDDYAEWLDSDAPPRFDAQGDPIPGAEIADQIRLKHRHWTPDGTGPGNMPAPAAGGL